MPKQARITGIKSLYCYKFDEAADVVGVSPRTIRNWVNQGLDVLDDEFPTLIRGDALKAFIKSQRASRKVPLKADEFYCLPCRKAQHAADGFAECKIDGKQARLVAFCAHCEGIVSKSISLDRLPEIRGLLDLTITQHKSTL